MFINIIVCIILYNCIIVCIICIILKVIFIYNPNRISGEFNKIRSLIIISITFKKKQNKYKILIIFISF